jgi:hypothetical protein
MKNVGSYSLCSNDVKASCKENDQIEIVVTAQPQPARHVGVLDSDWQRLPLRAERTRPILVAGKD